ncbi:hypothetical protein [Hominifimenecus sp. rT4P-3]|uniref:hypothetical protein n=1 Tax=Hominifimenecus sp. rT4P-3 TaxID=3242979 RepID=UPI003DA5E3E4
MKKRKIGKYLLSVMMCFSLLFGYGQELHAVTGAAKLYYFTGGGDCLGPGSTSSIKSRLSGMEYSAVRYSNSSKSTVLNAFGSSKVFHILTHGSAGRFSIGDTSNNIRITYSEIQSKYSSLSNLKFVFLEACSVAANSNMQDTLKSLGVSSSLAFKDTITAGTDSDGIHYYANRVYYYLAQGRTTSYAALKAKAETYEKYAKYYGSDSYSIYGIDTKLIG